MYWILKRNPLMTSKYLSFCLNKLQKNCCVRFCTAQPTITSKKKEFSVSLKYDPKEVESEWYDWWETKQYFKPSKSEHDSFVILLPPPNITGNLHLGHVLTTVIQDVIIRWKRMKGESVLWVPGIDHAGIATQVAVEKYLKQTLGASKHDLGKEEFVKKVWEWKEEKQNKIIEQCKNIGASLDWTRLKFTMDPFHSQIVTDAFLKLHNEGLIYRKESLVNWSCILKSAISDIEIDWVETTSRMKINVPGYEFPIVFGCLYKFAYKVCGEDEEIVVATTRPETMLGDVAIAVHPDDPLYAKFRDKSVWHPFRHVKIPIIFEDFVDRSFGTGAVKVTPSHSLVDFEVGLKYCLEKIDVINEEGCINKIGKEQKFHGLRRFHARKVILDELKALGLFRGFEDHAMKVPICSRSGDVVELIMKKQWFLKCKTLAEKALRVVKNGELKLEPNQFNNVWHEWLNNIKDWNLSRQLWWGHQIPMYECTRGDKAVWIAASNLEEAKSKATNSFNTSIDNITIRQDPDVLDTWFSSGLLPLNVYSNLDEHKNEKPPISLMVTGHDILFFWVARMVMLSIHLTGKLPFNHVLLNGIMCDSKGKKMSKSVGNVVLPEEIIKGCTLKDVRAQLESYQEKGWITINDVKVRLDTFNKMFPHGIPECGTDALRFSLCSYDIRNQFLNFDLNMCHANKHFCNKVWQAMCYFTKIINRYQSQNGGSEISFGKLDLDNLNCFDKWILSKLAALIEVVDYNMPIYNFYPATQAIRYFLVEEFCSTYLETSKIFLKGTSPSEYGNTILVFFNCLETSLRLLSPFMPFLTEHLYRAFIPSLNGYKKSESITVTKFPNPEKWSQYRNTQLENQFDIILKILTTLRKMRDMYKIPREQSKAFVKCSHYFTPTLFGEMGPVFSQFGGVENIVRVDDCNEKNVINERLSDACTVYIKCNHDKETLKEILKPVIMKEKGLKEMLEQHRVKSNEGKQKMTKNSEEVRRREKKIIAMEEELKKIKRFKQILEDYDK